MKIYVLSAALTLLFVTPVHAAASEKTGRLAELELRSLFRERVNDLLEHGHISSRVHASLIEVATHTPIQSTDMVFDFIQKKHRESFPIQNETDGKQ